MRDDVLVQPDVDEMKLNVRAESAHRDAQIRRRVGEAVRLPLGDIRVDLPVGDDDTSFVRGLKPGLTLDEKADCFIAKIEPVRRSDRRERPAGDPMAFRVGKKGVNLVRRDLARSEACDNGSIRLVGNGRLARNGLRPGHPAPADECEAEREADNRSHRSNV
jgi:hypothetical protein